jgi:hypothetical protein
MVQVSFDTRPDDTGSRSPSSRVLADLLDQAPADHFTLGWLMSRLQQRSFGLVMLMLGLLATAPIGSMVPGFMLVAVTVQMIAGFGEPVFPRFITARRLPTRHLVRIGGRFVPLLRYLERVVHPRWPTAFEGARRGVGIVILLLAIVLLLMPVPFSNIAPAAIIALIALAYTEEDGLLLCFSLLAGVVFLGVATAAVWGAILSAIFISHMP